MSLLHRSFRIFKGPFYQKILTSLVLFFLQAAFLTCIFIIMQREDRHSSGSALRDHWILAQRDRLLQVESICAADGHVDTSYEKVLNNERLLKVLIYNDAHKVIYCAIPKIASTNWKRVFAVLNGFIDAKDPREIAHEFVHDPRNRKSVLWDLKVEEQLRRLRSYKKFLFVRHPFERLVSAYKDKLRGNSSDSIEHFQKTYGAQMLKFVRPAASKRVIERGGDLHFEEFVRYLTDSPNPERMNEPHWKPMTGICEPCFVNYSFIGKYESMLLDAYMILDELGIKLPFLFPSKDQPQSRTNNELHSYMKNVSSEQVSKLYQAYKNDFQLFGYDYTH